MSYVKVRDVFVSYGHRPILERISLDVAEGEFISIVGASGCGKSTFLRLLLAEEQPSRGEIRIADAKPAQEPGRERGIVFQRYSVFPHLTVRENLVAAEAFAKPLGRPPRAERREARDRSQETLDRIGLGTMGEAYPAALSGGMQQRLAIAQALTARPRVLLLDEPFGALDPGTRLSMHDFLLELKRDTGMTVFMVTHDISEAFALGTRVLTFDKVRHDPQAPEAFGATITYDLQGYGAQLSNEEEDPDAAPAPHGQPVPAPPAP